MYIVNSVCPVCNNTNDVEVKSNTKESGFNVNNDMRIIEKVSEDNYLCDVTIYCQYCRLKHKEEVVVNIISN